MRPGPLAMIAAGLALASCNQARISGTGDSGSTAALTVTIDTFQGVPRGSWITDSSGNAYTEKDAVTITGKCTRGVQYVEVLASGSRLGANTSCSVSGTYSYSYTFSSDATYPLVFQPLDQNGNEVGTALSQGIVIQSQPPAAPVITTNGGAGFASTTSTLDLSGTISNDTVRLTVTAGALVSGANLSFGSGEFQYSATLPSGSATTFTFYAYDLTGQQSAPAQITVSYGLSTLLALSVFSSGGSGSEMTGASGNHLRALTLTPFISTSQPLLSSPGAFRLQTGATSIGAGSP